MPRFRKKPVEVEARQIPDVSERTKAWKGIMEWCGGSTAFRPIEKGKPTMVIDTLEGPMHAQPGWWVVKGVKGDFYPCDPEIFAMTYEEIPDA